MKLGIGNTATCTTYFEVLSRVFPVGTGVARAPGDLTRLWAARHKWTLKPVGFLNKNENQTWNERALGDILGFGFINL